MNINGRVSVGKAFLSVKERCEMKHYHIWL